MCLWHVAPHKEVLFDSSSVQIVRLFGYTEGMDYRWRRLHSIDQRAGNHGRALTELKICKKWKWWLLVSDILTSAYRGNTRAKAVHMARYILGMGLSDTRRADHIDGNSLNNIDENLRAVDKYQSIWKLRHEQQQQHRSDGRVLAQVLGQVHGQVLKAQIRHVGMLINLGECTTRWKRGAGFTMKLLFGCLVNLLGLRSRRIQCLS